MRIINIIRVLIIKLKVKNIDIGFKQNIRNNICIYTRNQGTIKIGNYGNIKQNCQIISHGDLTIGEHFFCNQNVSITCMNHVEIGDNVQIANNVVIVDHDHNYRSEKNEYTTGNVYIGNNVWIGANSIILRNTEIEDGVVIAAGSIVSGHVNSNSLFYQKRDTRIKSIERNE